MSEHGVTPPVSETPPLAELGAWVNTRVLLRTGILSIVLVVVLAAVAVLASVPFHDPDDGANMAAVWGFLVGPLAASWVGSYWAVWRSERRPILNGFIASGGAFAAGLLPVQLVIVIATRSAPATSSMLIGAVFTALMGAPLGLPGIAAGLWRRRHTDQAPAAPPGPPPPPDL